MLITKRDLSKFTDYQKGESLKAVLEKLISG